MARTTSTRFSRRRDGPPSRTPRIASPRPIQVRLCVSLAPRHHQLTNLITPTDQPLPPDLPTPYTTTLRSLLTHHLDIASIPRLSFFEWLAAFTEGDMAEKLRWFCTGEGQDDLGDYTTRPRRTTAEVMYEFRSAKIPKEYVMDLLPPLRPRGFSIASSEKVRSFGSCGPTRS